MESGGIMSASFDDGDVWDASSLSLDMLSIGVGPVDFGHGADTIYGVCLTSRSDSYFRSGGRTHRGLVR